MAVADIGAGSGVISVMLARNVGPAGTVFAVDIQEEMLSLLQKKAAQLGLENIEPVLGHVNTVEQRLPLECAWRRVYNESERSRRNPLHRALAE